MSSSNCCFLTCVQISQVASKVVWYSHLFQNFPQLVVICIVSSFGIVNKADIDVFLAISCFFDDPVDAANLLSGSSAFSKSSLNIWKFIVHVLLKPGLENFEHYFASVRHVCNCVVVWALSGIAFPWDWNDNWSFPVLRPLLSFPKFADILSAALSQHHLLGFETAQLEFITSTSFVCSEAHWTSHSSMSGSRSVITPSWLSGSQRSFLHSFSVYSCLSNCNSQDISLQCLKGPTDVLSF